MSASTIPAGAYAPPAPPLAGRIGWLRLLAAFRSNALAALPEACLHEPVVTLRLPFGGAMVLACTPEAVRQILVSGNDAFARLPAGRRVLGPIAGRGLVLAEGETWRQQRRVLAPAFTPRTVPLMAGHIARAADASAARLDATLGQPVDLHAEMQRLSLDIAATAMFSLEADAFGPRLRAMVSGYLGGLGRPTVADFLLPPGLPTPLSPRRALFRRRWTALVRGIVAARRAEGAGTEAPRDLFDLLRAAHGDGPDSLLVDEIGTMIVAGHETTASTLFWACTLLARSPAIQDALAGEAAGLDLGETGAAAALPRLRLARAVVQETLRLYPPAHVIARRAARAGEICGTAIPAGATVMIPTWVLHRNPRWWDRPELFSPARFLDGPEPDRHVYLPFGAGPQVCIGAQLALAEATLVLARLVRDYVLAIDGDRPVLPVATVTLRPDHSPLFRLGRRTVRA
ncbi:cytochrome P450 [uncultured Methylobacterium sp.]|jgi:cytochrome P450|uniref:cytochrome P450 n=1 Tax=uncultured Methylobacterium sp. TaxID=157278 RepID=UPI002613FA3E|nr:cytochrome P450 [uncultured Methylobacterium sp.]